MGELQRSTAACPSRRSLPLLHPSRSVLHCALLSRWPATLRAGPSGSGKTSLLSIMGARAQKQMRTEGAVTFNGAPLSKRLKRRVGYVMQARPPLAGCTGCGSTSCECFGVPAHQARAAPPLTNPPPPPPQDDLLYESLTVYETLYYAAMLRLPRHMPHADKLRRVELAITALGLASCRDTIIGGFFRKGISGGERKRASIGVELLINPSVLMLDEPTSGLDSTTSMHVLSMLRHLAGGGRAVVTTIHQPSSRLYQQLDKLLLLSKVGRKGCWVLGVGRTGGRGAAEPVLTPFQPLVQGARCMCGARTSMHSACFSTAPCQPPNHAGPRDVLRARRPRRRLVLAPGLHTALRLLPGRLHPGPGLR